MKRTRKKLTISAVLIAALSFSWDAPAQGSIEGRVYSLSGLSNTLVRYDANTLQPIGSAAQSNAYSQYDLAFDDTGRLFGNGYAAGQNTLFEYDPATGAMINSASITGGIRGLAARSGTIYGLSGLSNTLVRYDANTLQPIGSAAQSNAYSQYDLAFDDTGRLFGNGYAAGQNTLLEYDPATGTMINSAPITGDIRGLAAHQVPEPTVVGLLLVASALFNPRSRRRNS